MSPWGTHRDVPVEDLPRHPLSDDPYSVYWLVEHPSSNDDRVSDGSKPTAQVEQVSVGVLAVPLPVSPKLVEEPAFTRPL